MVFGTFLFQLAPELEWSIALAELIVYIVYYHSNRVDLFSHQSLLFIYIYRQTSNISDTQVGYEIIDHSDVAGA